MYVIDLNLASSCNILHISKMVSSWHLVENDSVKKNKAKKSVIHDWPCSFTTTLPSFWSFKFLHDDFSEDFGAVFLHVATRHSVASLEVWDHEPSKTVLKPKVTSFIRLHWELLLSKWELHEELKDVPREKNVQFVDKCKGMLKCNQIFFFSQNFRKVHYNCALSRVSEQCGRDTQVVRSLWIFCHGGRGRERRWSFRCKVCDQVNLGGKLLSLLGIFNSVQFSWFCPKQFTHCWTPLKGGPLFVAAWVSCWFQPCVFQSQLCFLACLLAEAGLGIFQHKIQFIIPNTFSNT